MKKMAVAFTGPSNSGKTTIIVKVAEILTKNYKVSIVKNDPKDKAKFDTKGKDSYKFSKTGAEVVVTSPTRTTFFSKQYKDIDGIIKMLGDFDFLLVEGLKTLPLPRIAVFRDKIDESYLSCTDALAIDDSIDLKTYTIPKNIDILDLNNPQQIIEWIYDNAKEC